MENGRSKQPVIVCKGGYVVAMKNKQKQRVMVQLREIGRNVGWTLYQDSDLPDIQQEVLRRLDRGKREHDYEPTTKTR